MTPRPRDGIVTIAIAVFLLAGVGLDTWGPKVTADPVVAEIDPAFTARASFCPPTLGKPEGSKRDPASLISNSLTMTAAARGDEAVTVGLEPASDVRTALEPEAVLEQKPPTAGATDVVGYGGRVDATVVTSIDEPLSGVGAAACAPAAATRWFFPEGNSTVTHDERLIVYNPFPDEAVVKVSLLTPGGEKSKAGLADQAVPSESSITLALKDYILEQKVLGAVVSATRGRVVAWRLSVARPDDLPSGVQFTLGATELADTWYFPEGAVGPGFEERLSILNPGTDEATVDVTLVSASRSVPAAGATEVPVPPRSTVSVVLDDAALAGERGGAGAIVESANGVPIVVERTVFYATQEIDGTASEIGSATPALRWFLGPATSHPDADTAVLLNVSSERAQVSLKLLSAGGRPLEPRSLANLSVPAGARLRVPLGEITDGEAYAVVVDASAPVVAERFSYSSGAGDVSSLMGIPLD